jgi:hypothetical protein
VRALSKQLRLENVTVGAYVRNRSNARRRRAVVAMTS